MNEKGLFLQESEEDWPDEGETDEDWPQEGEGF